MSLEGFARVDAFATDEGQHPHASPADLVSMWQARRMAGKGLPLHVSRLQHAYLTAALGVNGGGHGVDEAAQAKQLADLWHWWSRNVRGRIYVPDHPGLIGILDPPRKVAPRPLPAEPTPGDWLDATQQRGWWITQRRLYGGHVARRQAQVWTELRDAAQPVTDAQLPKVLALVDEVEQQQQHQVAAVPAAASTAKSGRW